MRTSQEKVRSTREKGCVVCLRALVVTSPFPPSPQPPFILPSSSLSPHPPLLHPLQRVEQKTRRQRKSSSVMPRPAGPAGCSPPWWGSPPSSTPVRAEPERCTTSCWGSTSTPPCLSPPSTTDHTHTTTWRRNRTPSQV